MISLMLDSGAFGAWKRGIELPLDDYVSYVKANAKAVTSYVNMDVIPGDKGRMVHTPSAVEQSAGASYKNLQYLKRRGLSPIPVFHQGETFKWLERLLDDGEDYIGISPYFKSHRADVASWLVECFMCIKKRRGYVKTHGFGMTQHDLIIKHPWYTVDSTTWVIQAAYGLVFFPQYHNGQFDYVRQPIKFSATGKAKSIDYRRQLKYLGPIGQRAVNLFLDEVGITLEELCESAEPRVRMRLLYFQKLEQYKRTLTDTPFSIVFATNLSAHPRNKLLNDCGEHDRLLSYFDLRDVPGSVLSQYVKEGFVYKRASK